MASSKQSASEFLNNARCSLVENLTNLSIIADYLCQKRVFNKEEVSKIEVEPDDYDKSRSILNAVTQKGEYACYECLKIIYLTRRRTLKDKDSTSTDCTDLKSLISCFPFKDEDIDIDKNFLKGSKPCCRYQAKLKSKAQKISENVWKQSKVYFSNKENTKLSYTPLVLDTQGKVTASKLKNLKSKKSKKTRLKKLKSYIPNKEEFSLNDLLKTTEKKILLVGKPGIGKTATVHQMLKLWAEKDDRELDYMFYFDMRETSHITEGMSLEQLLFNVFLEPDQGKEEVLQDIKRNSDAVTIFFDGVTESSSSVVQGFINKDLLPDAKIIISCRPELESEDFLSDWDSLRVEIKGFSEKDINTYLSNMLSTEQLNKVLKNLELVSLCHVPMYALMVVASFSFESPEKPPCTITEIYIHILRFCMRRDCNKTRSHLDSFITDHRNEIQQLSKVAFLATQAKAVNLTKDVSFHSSFLKTLEVQVSPTAWTTSSAFLHYTMQEFFAALWLLMNPDQIRSVLQQCLRAETEHMKHLVLFICGLLDENNCDLLKCLIPAEQIKGTSHWFFKILVEMLPNPMNPEDCGPDIDMLFICQCLYESQCPEACLDLLDKQGYRLDLNGQSLDPHHCCAVSYVVSQSKERQIYLNFEDAVVSEQGLQLLFGCLQNVQMYGCESLLQQLWKWFLLSEANMDSITMLGHHRNQLYLPLNGTRRLFERAAELLQCSSEKIHVCLHSDQKAAVCQSLSDTLLKCLPNINSLRFRTSRVGSLLDQTQNRKTLELEEKELFLHLCLKAVMQTGNVENVVKMLSLCSVNIRSCDIFLDFYQHIKSQGCLSVIPMLKPLFQSTVWIIDLSERRSSLLLEVLQLQPEKKAVKLKGCSAEESEVRSFLQCLPYISELSFDKDICKAQEAAKILVKLFCGAAEREEQTGEKTLELLSSVCSHEDFPLHQQYDDVYYQSTFLLDLFFHLKDDETPTVRRVRPALQSLFQSGPAVWIIDLSERRSSLLLEVLQLQPEKKAVELKRCSAEESEVRSFLQCLPYISELSFDKDICKAQEAAKILVKLFCGAAEREEQTGEKTLELLSSVCSHEDFPLHQQYDDVYYQSTFLLDLFFHLKDDETPTVRRVRPALQSLFQSGPAVWIIDLSERRSSLLLEVLQLQPEKKAVELKRCSAEESEVRSFLQCLPYISELSFDKDICEAQEAAKILVKLFCGAAEREEQTGEKTLELLSSVCSHESFPLYQQYDDVYYQSTFLLDLFFHLKDDETPTVRRVRPALQSLFQSGPAVWIIDLSERRSSLLLEVLQLQPKKKAVKLRGCSAEESKVRSFLQCLPYISELSFDKDICEAQEAAKILVKLFCGAAEREEQTGEKTLELLSSVCSHESFPLYQQYDDVYYQSTFLLDLFFHLKDDETPTVRRVRPALQSLFQSGPAVWIIDLSERRSSLLLEVLQLQPKKKAVKLRGCSAEESKVRSFLQCLPYISELSFDKDICKAQEAAKILVKLFCGAAEREEQTGEKTLELLSSVCSHEDFPLHQQYDDVYYQSTFLLDLFFHLKDDETPTVRRVRPALQSLFQSGPAVWIIDLSERRSSLLLEVLQLQPEKKAVELKRCSAEESEVRSFLQCLPYISELSCDPKFFQCVCESFRATSTEETKQLASLLQLLDFRLLLEGKLRSKTCRSVGKVLGFCGSKVDLILTPSRICVKGASLLFSHTSKLHSLGLSAHMVCLLFRWIRTGRVANPLAMGKLFLVGKTTQSSESVLLKATSRMATLLRYWTVDCLDLTECRVPVGHLITLLLHHGPLTIRLSETDSHQLLELLHEIQDENLTQCFLSKVGRDLTSISLDWVRLQYLLQQSTQAITVNLRKNRVLEKELTHLLPFLDRIVFKRPSPSFTLSIINESFKLQLHESTSSVLRSLDQEVNLNCRELDTLDCDALLFTLKHSDGVKLKLMWTSIPPRSIQSILFILERVSELSVDRGLLLRFLHCCAACEAQQGAAAAAGLLRTLQHKLNLSCSSCVELTEQHRGEAERVTAADCLAVSSVLTHSSRTTQLNLTDCEVEDRGLDLLFPVLDKVHISIGKAGLLQLLSLVHGHSEGDAVRRAQSLCGALRGNLDVSHTALDQRTCEMLAHMLDYCDGLKELDVSHCQLTDQLLLTLIAHLHKAEVVDLSHNKITDASTDRLLPLVSVNSVRIFGNNIMDKTPFMKDKRFEIW
ncbi:uncharacterized protein LOC143012674 isoform X2 [Genypterus blacodes]|uniref:uncharacterized protein LOC143012674 isoform X2 n=1 Tax=Genypterus blacodes TaxID=154954 RepID=UPI003F7712C5